jgi:hypothetical protein
MLETPRDMGGPPGIKSNRRSRSHGSRRFQGFALGLEISMSFAWSCVDVKYISTSSIYVDCPRGIHSWPWDLCDGVSKLCTKYCTADGTVLVVSRSYPGPSGQRGLAPIGIMIMYCT